MHTEDYHVVISDPFMWKIEFAFSLDKASIFQSLRQLI